MLFRSGFNWNRLYLNNINVEKNTQFYRGESTDYFTDTTQNKVEIEVVPVWGPTVYI